MKTPLLSLNEILGRIKYAHRKGATDRQIWEAIRDTEDFKFYVKKFKTTPLKLLKKFGSSEIVIDPEQRLDLNKIMRGAPFEYSKETTPDLATTFREMPRMSDDIAPDHFPPPIPTATPTPTITTPQEPTLQQSLMGGDFKFGGGSPSILPATPEGERFAVPVSTQVSPTPISVPSPTPKEIPTLKEYEPPLLTEKQVPTESESRALAFSMGATQAITFGYMTPEKQIEKAKTTEDANLARYAIIKHSVSNKIGYGVAELGKFWAQANLWGLTGWSAKTASTIGHTLLGKMATGAVEKVPLFTVDAVIRKSVEKARTKEPITTKDLKDIGVAMGRGLGWSVTGALPTKALRTFGAMSVGAGLTAIEGGNANEILLSGAIFGLLSAVQGQGTNLAISRKALTSAIEKYHISIGFDKSLAKEVARGLEKSLWIRVVSKYPKITPQESVRFADEFTKRLHKLLKTASETIKTPKDIHRIPALVHQVYPDLKIPTLLKQKPTPPFKPAPEILPEQTVAKLRTLGYPEEAISRIPAPLVANQIIKQLEAKAKLIPPTVTEAPLPTIEKEVEAEATYSKVMEYAGEHKAPNRSDDNATSLDDLTGMYPDDIYSSQATRYYGAGETFDYESISIIQSFRGKPNSSLRIYRAVPSQKTSIEMIEMLESQKKSIQRRGKIPPKPITNKFTNSSDYYNFIYDEINRLKKLPTEPKIEKLKINPGDWVSINRKYTKQHGENEFGKNYKILSKIVKAKELFTEANSIHEWGYDPVVSKTAITEPTISPVTPEIDPSVPEKVVEGRKPLVEEAKEFESVEKFRKSLKLEENFIAIPELKNKDFILTIKNIKDIKPTQAMGTESQAENVRHFVTKLEKGQAQPPIIIDKKGNIINGNRRYEALLKFGKKQIQVLQIKGDGTGEITNLIEIFNQSKPAPKKVTLIPDVVEKPVVKKPKVTEVKDIPKKDLATFPMGKEALLSKIREAFLKAPASIMQEANREKLDKEKMGEDTWKKGGVYRSDLEQKIKDLERAEKRKDPKSYIEMLKHNIEIGKKGGIVERTVKIQVDGGYTIPNTKEALWEIYQKIKFTPEKITTPKPPAPYKPHTATKTSRQEYIIKTEKEIIKIEKDLDNKDYEYEERRREAILDAFERTDYRNIDKSLADRRTENFELKEHIKTLKSIPHIAKYKATIKSNEGFIQHFEALKNKKIKAYDKTNKPNLEQTKDFLRRRITSLKANIESMRELLKEPIVKSKVSKPATSDIFIGKLAKTEADAFKRLKSRKGRLMAGIPIEDLADYTIIGASKIAKGLVKFSQWSSAMVKDFGVKIKPHLPMLWTESNKYLNAFNEQVEQERAKRKPKVKIKKPAPKLTGQEFIKLKRLGYTQAEINKMSIERRKTVIENEEVGATQELSAKEWGVEMAKEPKGEEKINKTQIINFIEKAFKIKIRSKVTHRFKDIAGIYQTKAELIRLSKWGELEPLTHELAHHIDKKMRQSLGVHWRKELAPIGQRKSLLKELAGLDYHPRLRRTSEGFAEFMRYFLTTNKAKDKAPLFYKFFTENFLINNPDISSKLSALKKQLDIWQKQGAENRVRAQIDFKGEHTKVGGIRHKLERAREWVLKNFDDEFYYPKKIVSEIEKIRGANLKPTENPATMLEYSKSKAGMIARTFVMEKAVNMYGKVIGKGLIEIIEPIPREKMEPFIIYAVARRAILKMQQGKETGIDIADAKYVVNKHKNETWDKAVDEITEWGDNIMGWLVSARGLGTKEYAIIKQMNPIWIPFKRAFVDHLTVIKGAGGYINSGTMVKRMKGSARPIINPIESLITTLTETIAKAQKIHIVNLFADLSETEGVGGFMTKVPAPMEATTVTIKEMQRNLELLGIDTAGADLDALITVFTQGWQYKGKENIISIWRNGKRSFYEIHPDLYRALSGVDMLQMGPLLKILAPFARLLRLGATGARMAFGIRNPWRDAFTYAVLSKSKTATVFDPIIGTYKSIKATPTVHPLVWKFKAMGGELSGFLGQDRAATMAVYDDMLLSKLGKKGKGLKVVKHPLNAMRNLLSIPELGPRSVEVERVYNQSLKNHPDWSSEDAWVYAFNSAQDVTVNFLKSGYYAKRINACAAFFNVAIRGPEKIYRTLRERPIQTIVKGITWITIFAIANWEKNKDKQWYKNLPLSYKYNNYWFEIGDTIYRLPIPFDLGMIFSAAPIAGLEAWYSKDLAPVKAWLQMLKLQIPDPTPSMFKPVIDVERNKDFLDRPIETPGMQYLPATERRRKHTTALAIALSKGASKIGLSYSPVQIDYLINNYTGGWTRQIPLRKPKGKEDFPVLGEFILRNPHKPARQLNEFYLTFETLNQKKQAGMITTKESLQLKNTKLLHDELTICYKILKEYYGQEDKESEINKILVLMTESLKSYGFD